MSVYPCVCLSASVCLPICTCVSVCLCLSDTSVSGIEEQKGTRTHVHSRISVIEIFRTTPSHFWCSGLSRMRTLRSIRPHRIIQYYFVTGRILLKKNDCSGGFGRASTPSAQSAPRRPWITSSSTGSSLDFFLGIITSAGNGRGRNNVRLVWKNRAELPPVLACATGVRRVPRLVGHDLPSVVETCMRRACEPLKPCYSGDVGDGRIPVSQFLVSFFLSVWCCNASLGV